MHTSTASFIQLFCTTVLWIRAGKIVETPTQPLPMTILETTPNPQQMRGLPSFLILYKKQTFELLIPCFLFHRHKPHHSVYIVLSIIDFLH